LARPIAPAGQRANYPARAGAEGRDEILQPIESGTAGALSGSARVPGDKSISHRALMVGALAVGESQIHGLLEGEDVLRSAAAMRALGAEAWREEGGLWRVVGRGIGGLMEPEDVLDLGNAGTGARLLMGVVASHPVAAVFTGDASLRRRPMGRVAEPLRQMGARFAGREGYRLPLVVSGTADPMPIRYRLPVPSAQVKSAILLAGLNTPGETTVIEPEPTRDHTELMLRHFGAAVSSRQTPEGRAVTILGQPEITGRRIEVPGDPSSAAFPLVAALLVPGSDILLTNVGLNRHRIGLIETLLEMGAAIEIRDRREQAGEPVGDIRVKASRLSGVAVPPSRAPSMIDEYPILAVAAAFAEGETLMEGLGELRVKESDRLGAVARGLAACGVDVAEGPDSLRVRGHGSPPEGGARIETALDHRIAMAFLVLGMAARRPTAIDDGSPIDTSFPGFLALMNALGGKLSAS
jgi:3-phosphoshikimate 1-carboxyvinyltransferase